MWLRVRVLRKILRLVRRLLVLGLGVGIALLGRLLIGWLNGWAG